MRTNIPHLLLLLALPAWWQLSREGPAWSQLPLWLLLCLLVLALGEQLWPQRADWQPDAPRLRRDGALLGLNLLAGALSSALLAQLSLQFCAAETHWPFLLQLGLGLLLGELGSYALHRYSHRGGWWWSVHLLHHRPEQVNVANALTAHPLNALADQIVRGLPLFALGVSADAILLIHGFVLAQSLAVHANIAGSIGPLGLLIGHAELHRLHHSVDPAQAANFGTALPLWDQLFGTCRRGQPVAVGVFDRRGLPDELQWGTLLRWPLKGRQATLPSTQTATFSENDSA